MLGLFSTTAGIRKWTLPAVALLWLGSIPIVSAHPQEGQPSQQRELETLPAESRGEDPSASVPGSEQKEPLDRETDRETLLSAVTAADLAYVQSARQRDEATFRDLLAEDVIFLADEARKGRLSVLTLWQPLFEGKYDFRYEGDHMETHVAESGDLAWTIGTAVTRFTRPGLSEEEVTESFYLNVWAPDTDGKWLLRVISSLVVHPTLGSARDPRSGLMTAWPELADQIGAEIDLRWIPSTTVRAASGELAYSLGEYEASFKSPATEADTGKDSTVSGKGHFVAVWQKDEKGAWQLAAEGFTPPGIYPSGDE